MLDFLLANYIFAMFLIVFVFFFCYRMFTNTKKAGVFIIISVGTFLTYILYHDKEFLQKIILMSSNSWAIIGYILFVLSSVGLFIGFLHEETSEESIHGRLYWIGMVALTYISTYCMAVAANSI